MNEHSELVDRLGDELCDLIERRERRPRKARRCGAKFGKRNELTCKRPEGHKGNHAIRATVDELRRMMGLPR